MEDTADCIKNPDLKEQINKIGCCVNQKNWILGFANSCLTHT